MELLSQRDYQAILSTIEKIHTTQDIQQLPTHILAAIKNAVPCDLATYNEVNRERTRINSISGSPEITEDPNVQEILWRYLREHPLVSYYARTGDGSSVKISDFMTQRQLHDLGLYQEFYKPLNLEYQMTASIMIGSRRLIGIALSRNRLDFSEKERLMLDLFHPHLVQAYQNVQAIDLARRNTTVGSSREFVTANRFGQVQFSTDKVWQMLARYCSLRRPSGILPDEVNDWFTRERARLSDESDVPLPLVPLRLYTDNTCLTIRLLWGGEKAEQDVLLFEEEPIEQIATMPTYSRLTPREIDILTMVSKGKTNAEIGHVLAISPRTVKKHLEHIYRKLRVHTRGAAVARFLRL